VEQHRIRWIRFNNTPWSILIKIIGSLNHPVIIFVGLQIVWIAVTLLWVMWFLNQNEAVESFRQALGDKAVSSPYTIGILVLGCTLLGLILVGMVLLFYFILKQKSLIRQQRSFVSSITHELKSPLASLQLSLDTIQRKDLPRLVAQRLVLMAQGDIERLLKLVNRILLSGQIDRGVFSFGTNQEVFNMKELIETIRTQTEYMDVNLEQRLTIKCPEDLQVQTFKMAIVLIIGNLLENAVKYSPRGTPIEVEIRQEADALMISVKDEGFGLLKKDLKKIFKMFYRSGIATKKALPGAGLGLYLIKSTAKILGGQVWATSRGPNCGATFHVIIPHKRMGV
jgi:signal transduction histidine kinase